MNRSQAKKLANYHKFTIGELYEILEKAYYELPEDFWKKPNKVNRIFDNGAYFNYCINWVGYKKGVNDKDIASEIVVFRVLEVFHKFSKIQLPKNKKLKSKIDVKCSQKPSLNQKNF